MGIPLRVVTALLLCGAVAFANGTTIELAQQAPEATADKEMTKAKDASVEADKGVTKDAVIHDARALKKEAKLGSLSSSLKAAAAGVAQKAAVDAASEVSRPYIRKYSKTIRARRSAEKSAAAAKQRLDAAEAEQHKQDQAVVAALTAERAAAVASTEQFEYKAHLLEGKLAALHQSEDGARNEAIKQAQEASEARIQAASQSQVSHFTQQADAAEKAAQTAKAGMQEALRAKSKAAALKAKALQLKKERDTLKQESEASTTNTQLVEEQIVPEHVRHTHHDANSQSSAWTSKTMARASVMFLCVGVASLALALGTQRAKA